MNTPIKSIITFIIFLLCTFSLSSNSVRDSAETYLQQANEFYQKNQFEDAIGLYSKTVDLQFESTVLYYNLGNAYFKNGENAKAILWFEKARRLDPNNEDIIHNVAFVQQKLIDKIEVLPELFIVKWWNVCSNLFTENQWANLSIIACSIFALCFLLILLIRISWIRTTTIFIIILASFLTIFSLVFAKKVTNRYTQQPEGIIMQHVINVKSTPNEKGSDLFVIHSGLKVGITDRLNEWVEIRLPNGEKGWILAGQIEEI
jgi:tetratricopeptide (TPR) repeat protein